MLSLRQTFCAPETSQHNSDNMKRLLFLLLALQLCAVVAVDYIDTDRVILTHEIDDIANHTHADRHHGDAHSGSTILFIFAACLFGGMIEITCIMYSRIF